MATFRKTLLLTLGLLLQGGLYPLPGLANPPDPKAMLTTPPTPHQEESLGKGEIVVHLVNRHPIYHLDVYGLIDAPFPAVWEAVTSYDHYHQFLPLVVESGIRKKSRDNTWQFVRMQPPWPLHDHWMVNINVEQRHKGVVSWTMADGNLRFERGYWQMAPQGQDRTRLQYHLTVDPWLDIVPGWLIEFATRSVLPDVIKGVRARVKTVAAQRPRG
ncbi:MAG: SRPBCC family protein [Candidatus Sericytochromatia bacterium]|nr:SRPBCC family protein [Candidatus Sericytochromatia bacterium]